MAYERGYRVNDDGSVTGLRGEPLSFNIDPRGFERFTHNGARLTCFVHKLAAYQLFGEASFEPGTCVLHRNTDRRDNRLQNIILGTRRDAMMQRSETHRLLLALNAARSLRSLSDSELSAFRLMRAEGASLNTLARHFGIAKSTASYIVNGKTYA